MYQSMPIPKWAEPDRRVPTGVHRVVVISSERFYPQSGVPYVVMRYMVVGKGRFAGRTIDDVFQLHDLNPIIRDDEYQRLSMLCHATDMLEIGANSYELHGRPFEVGVRTVGRVSIVESYASVKPGSPTYKVHDPETAEAVEREAYERSIEQAEEYARTA